MKMMAAPAGTPAWPMAFALLACGMPQRAAWSTAEAGAHANEASRKAAEGLEQMFSAYRSDGGHAIAQILWAGRGRH
jgi:2,4-dienoyl-CoA reductase-like NADH-dependent reductase (Old Yellow Enzyme family)